MIQSEPVKAVALTVGERTGMDAETFQGVLEVIARSNKRRLSEEGADKGKGGRPPDSTNIFKRGSTRS